MQFGEDEEQSLLDSSGTSKARMHNRDSELMSGDTGCGEPLLAQRLLIDFTPREELDIDSKYNQKKCRAFWNFIKSKPELQHLMAVPEALDYGESVTSSGYQNSKASAEAPELVERTAVSTLELVEKEGQMEPVFVGLAPRSHCSHCSLGSREYPESLITTKKSKKKPLVCACKGSCDLCRRSKRRNRARGANSALAVDLCQKIDKWDAEHPNCRPICKSRRREWQGALLDTSAEQLLDRKPTPECFRRCPTKVFPNNGCPLFGRTRRVTLLPRDAHLNPEVVRICLAPLDHTVDTTYLNHADLAKSIGAWGSVRARCAFCACGRCCACARANYEPRDADRAGAARSDMRQYDARVARTYQQMRIMYDK